ncbi:MAG: nuclear transport factor 2 family protein [Halioglobus sp.]|nr:nuclear transport factor 2 family protein [Halioglobus sp.]
MSIRVEDHIEIERLMYLYARCADHKDYDGFAGVFCDDAVFEYRGHEVSPLDAICELMHNLEKYPVTQHRVQNVLYDVDEDRAVGETYCLASHLLASGDGAEKVDMAIVYADELRRTGDGWRIARRAFNLLWTQTSRIDDA